MHASRAALAVTGADLGPGTIVAVLGLGAVLQAAVATKPAVRWGERTRAQAPAAGGATRLVGAR
jgi:hypothetical protein